MADSRSTDPTIKEIEMRLIECLADLLVEYLPITVVVLLLLAVGFCCVVGASLIYTGN